MSALPKYEAFESHSAEVAAPKSTWEPVLYKIVRRPRNENTAAVETGSAATKAKNIALFLASPFIGLAYVAAMPFVAAGMLAYFAGKAAFAKSPLVKHVSMMIAAPFIGLAMILAAPIVGAGALGYYATKALAKN
jgi:hypothetical protein